MPTPNYDLGLLIALCIGLVLIGLLTAVSGIWIISRQIALSTREIIQQVSNVGAMTQNVAAMTREILRRTE